MLIGSTKPAQLILFNGKGAPLIFERLMERSRGAGGMILNLLIVHHMISQIMSGNLVVRQTPACRMEKYRLLTFPQPTGLDG